MNRSFRNRRGEFESIGAPARVYSPEVHMRISRYHDHRRRWNGIQPAPAVAAMLLALAFSACAQAAPPDATATLALEFAFSTEFSARISRMGIAGPRAAAGSGAGSVSYAGTRSLAPSDPWVPVRYEVAGSGPGGASVNLQATVGTARTRLVPGSWSFVITGFSASDKPVARATGEALMEAGRESSLSLVLSPLQGSGTLALAFSLNYPVSDAGRIVGSIRYEGLPGSSAPAGSTRVIDVPASQADLEMSDLAAGFYALSLSVQDKGGTVGGLSETVLVLEGHRTEGLCSFTLGEPSLSLSMGALNVLVDNSMLMQVPMTVSRHHAISLAAFRGDASSPGTWTVNGEAAGAAAPGTRAGLPAGIVLSGAIGTAALPIVSRADLLVGPGTDNSFGSASSLLRAGEGPVASRWSWRASFEADAALSASRFQRSDPDNAGTGTAAPVNAVAATPAGLVAVAGLDHDHALHLFKSAADLDYSVGTEAMVAKSGSGWIRLWRDKLVVSSSARSADRLAFSRDGTKLAVASSSGTWLRLIHLGQEGNILAIADITHSGVDLADFSAIKAIEFTPDGSRLYALANSPEAVYVFNSGTVGTTLPLMARVSLEGLSENPSMGMDDLAVTAEQMVLVSASSIGKLFVLKTVDTMLGFTGVLNPPVSNPWTSPEQLEFSADGLDLYLLGNGRTLYRYHRDTTSASLSYKDQLALPLSVQGVERMAYGTVDSASGTQPCLGLTGGPGIALVPLTIPSLSTASVDAILPGAVDGTGTGVSVDGAFTGRAFVTAGDGACVVSVFGSD